MKNYKDKLHIPSANLVVNDIEGRPLFMLNKALMDKQNCWHNLELIKKLHTERLWIELRMTGLTLDSTALEQLTLLKEWEENQYLLQDAWGFPRDSRFHPFYLIPSCLCPKLDNSEYIPKGRYYISNTCPIHSSRNLAEQQKCQTSSVTSPNIYHRALAKLKHFWKSLKRGPYQM